MAMARRARLVTALAAALVSISACGGGGGSSDGACAAPFLGVEPATVRAGDDVTVTGEGMFEGCADHFSVSDTGEVVAQEEQHPFRDVELRLSSEDGEAVALAVVSADDEGRFVAPVTVPATVAGGSWVVTAPGTFAEPAELRVEAAQP